MNSRIRPRDFGHWKCF